MKLECAVSKGISGNVEWGTGEEKPLETGVSAGSRPEDSTVRGEQVTDPKSLALRSQKCVNNARARTHTYMYLILEKIDVNFFRHPH